MQLARSAEIPRKFPVTGQTKQYAEAPLPTKMELEGQMQVLVLAFHFIVCDTHVQEYGSAFDRVKAVALAQE